MQIREIRINQAKEGMLVAQDVYTNNNELILTRNTILSVAILRRLKELGVYRLCVYDQEETNKLASIAARVAAEQQTELHIEKIKKSPEFKQFTKEFDHTVDGLKKNFSRILEHNDIDGMLQITFQVEKIVHSGGTYHVMDMLNCIREYDDVTFAHSISVSILCRIIGEWLHLDKADKDVLVLCGLLHDIGKLQIPNSIISKPGKLTDEEFTIVKQHPKLGYNIIKDMDLDERIKMATLMHHERCDGMGYPLKVTGGKIGLFTKIVMIADVYDAMTADRSYRRGMCPFKVIDILMEEGYQKYDPLVLLPFIEKTVQSYINTTVKLSNETIGEIVAIDTNQLTRPLVQVGDQFIDLRKEKEMQIIKIL